MTDTTWTPTDEQVRIATEAMEDAALEFIGRDRRVGPGDIARAALVAVGPHIAAQALRDAAEDFLYNAWDEGYRSGISDERTAASLGRPAEPNRNNPYREKGDDR